MNSRSWRGTILFTVILVVMGATVGVKLYGVGEESTTPATAAGSQPTATPTPTPTSPTTTTDATASVVTGSAVQTRYGVVQVKVTFAGSRITAVDTLQSPNRDGRDIEINQQALPLLQSEVLASQSAKIDTVSGATYTSEGYIQSVQSAIDQR
ncbi:FMN-binding protein [Leifsonia sp. NPDC058194]|uniref:FMN-binding protein n=1 Tax=Leifsonia sp. NPDC058194 TaxID=3346374 RepID=UPI0036DBED5E